MGRKAISKKVRFEVFKRDAFTCQYCGSHPPKVVLEVDHIVPVCEGGENEDTNLITSCFDCNRGKAGNPLASIPQSLAAKAADIAEREAQIRGYAEVAAARRERIEANVWFVFRHWRGQKRTTHNRFNSVKMFIEKLGLEDVLDAVDISLGKQIRNDESEFKYFCGICWNKIRGGGS